MTDKLFEDNKEILDTLTKVVVAKLNNFKKEQKNLGKEPPSLLKIFEISKEIEKSNADQAIAYLNLFDAKIDGLASTAEKYKFVQEEETRVQTLISRAKAQRNGYERKHYERAIINVIQPRLERILKQLETEKRFPEVASVQVQLPLTNTAKKIPEEKKEKAANDEIKWNLTPDEYTVVVDELIGLGKFKDEDKPNLLEAYYNKSIAAKIVWFGNANIWLTILFDLKTNNKIKSSKISIANWVEKYFEYEVDHVKHGYEYNYTYETLNKGRPDKRPHRSSPHYIDILSILE